VTSSGKDAFNKAFSSTATIWNRLQQIGNLATALQSATGTNLDRIKGILNDILPIDGAQNNDLSEATQDIQLFSSQPWDDLATATPTTNTEPTASQSTQNESSTGRSITSAPSSSSLSSSKTSSTTSSSTAASPTTSYYFIRSKTGTTNSQFQNWVKTLPDQGNGVLDTIPNGPNQSYLTWLNETEAREIAALPFILQCAPVPTPVIAIPGFHHSSSEASSENDFLSKVPQRRADIPHPQSNTLYYRSPSAPHLKLISRQRGAGSQQLYTFDPQLGAGISIYIVDTGFNIAHQVCHHSVSDTLVPTFASRNSMKPCEVLQCIPTLSQIATHLPL
jgi:hypothetical protein